MDVELAEFRTSITVEIRAPEDAGGTATYTSVATSPSGMAGATGGGYGY